jgi:hypothetical protein
MWAESCDSSMLLLRAIWCLKQGRLNNSSQCSNRTLLVLSFADEESHTAPCFTAEYGRSAQYTGTPDVGCVVTRRIMRSLNHPLQHPEFGSSLGIRKPPRALLVLSDPRRLVFRGSTSIVIPSAKEAYWRRTTTTCPDSCENMGARRGLTNTGSSRVELFRAFRSQQANSRHQ